MSDSIPVYGKSGRLIRALDEMRRMTGITDVYIVYNYELADE